MRSPFGFMIIFLLPFAVWCGVTLGGFWIFAPLILVFGLLPLLDAVVGIDTRNPTPEEEVVLRQRRIYRVIPWICAPVQVAMVAWGVHVFTQAPMDLFERVGLVLSLGVSSGALGINVPHELIHRIDNRLEPFLGRVMLSTVCYMHWAIEHVKGHHRNVATPVDPATARQGQSVYAFWIQTVKGTWRDAWQIEAKKLARKGKNVWSAGNPLLRYLALEVALVICLGWAFGLGGLFFFFAQALVAVSHAAPERRYQILRHFDKSPQLPNGYAGMVLLALVPPLWRRVMDPKVRVSRDADGARSARSE